MAFALRPEDFYHTGIIVPDLDAAMAWLSALAGYRWITPLSYTLPFRTATGTRELTSTIVYSVRVRTSNSCRKFLEVRGRLRRATPSITSATSPTTSATPPECWRPTASPSK
jgi:hypothetical protein